MSEMVDRVANAMKARTGILIAESFWQEAARAAIEAMLKEAATLADPGGDIALHKLEEAMSIGGVRR